MSKFIVKNFAINLVTIILIQTASRNLQPICCFWLTDGISFQPIVDSIGLSQAPKGELSPKAGLSIKPTDAQGNSEQQADQLKATIATNSLATSNERDNKNNKAFEPVTWPLRATNQQSDELAQLNSSRPDAQNQSVPVCQCSPEWAHNQTSQWLARWLSGPTFANQVRSVVFMSNSTVAKKQHQWKQQQQHQAKQHNGNHLSAWVRAKNNNARTHTRTKWERSPGGLAATTPASIATTTTTTTKASIVYERGPKGDQGPRGERGPSGLISVKDRDALFDLVDFEQNDLAEGRPQQQSSPDAGSPAAKSRPRLAYVESEQMLVVATMTGWRPVPLAAPLRDFRKTVAKFRLNKEEDRRRLLTLNADQSLSDNSISAGVAFRVADKNEIFENNDDVDGVDQDEEGDDDDEDDEDDDDEDDDNEDDDEDDEGDDNQDDNNENLVLTPKAIKVALTAKQAANPKRRRAQLTSRSGGGQIIDNSISAPPLATKMSLEGSAKRSTEAESGPAMKQLRMVALNEPFSGNLHGLRGANFECKRNAARANIKGAFRAFLGANYQNLNEIVRHNGAQKYPIVNLRGETLASSWHDLFKAPARMTNPLSRLYSFDGRHVASDSNWPNKLVWHGSGNRLGHRDSLHNCDGWHSDSLSKFGYASPLHPPRGLHHSSSSSSSSVSATNRLTQQRNPIHRRFLDQISANNSTNSMADTTTTTTTTNMPPFLDAIDKYPCRMPLIVLCMETIAQSNE